MVTPHPFCTHLKTVTSFVLTSHKAPNEHLALPYHVAFIISIIPLLVGLIQVELLQQQPRGGPAIAVLVLGDRSPGAVHAAGAVQGRHLQSILEVKGAFCFQRLHAVRQRAIEAGALLIRAVPFLRALLALPGQERPALAALAPPLEAGGAADAVPAGAAAVPGAAGPPGAVRGAAGAGLRGGQRQGAGHSRAGRTDSPPNIRTRMKYRGFELGVRRGAAGPAGLAALSRLPEHGPGQGHGSGGRVDDQRRRQALLQLRGLAQGHHCKTRAGFRGIDLQPGRGQEKMLSWESSALRSGRWGHKNPSGELLGGVKQEWGQGSMESRYQTQNVTFNLQ